MSGAQSKRQRWIKLAACAAFVGLGVAAFFISRAQKDPPFAIDPLTPRPWADSTALIDLSAQAPWTVSAAQFFKGLKWNSTPEPSLQIGINAQLPPYRLIPPDDANPALNLKAFALGGWSKLPEKAAYSGHGRWPDAPLRFYDPQTGSALAAPAIPRATPLISAFNWPLTFQAWLEPRVPQAQLQTWYPHDAFTHVIISSSRGTQLLPGGGIIAAGDLRTLRPNSARLAVDMAVGEVPGGDLDIAVGKLTFADGAELRVFELNADPAETIPFQQVEEGAGGTIRFQPMSPPGNRPITNIYLGAYPHGDRSGFRFQAVDSAGKELLSQTFGLQGAGFLIRVRADAAEIHHLRVTRPERYLRQIVALPPIAELPAANADVKDMWDLIIPCHRAPIAESTAFINAYCQTQTTSSLVPIPLGMASLFPAPNLVLEGEQMTVRDFYQQMNAGFKEVLLFV